MKGRQGSDLRIYCVPLHGVLSLKTMLWVTMWKGMRMGGRADYAQAKRCDEPRFFVRHGLTIIDCEMRYGRERMRM